jgi:quercetin dioxygenase-like cupin family protein
MHRFVVFGLALFAMATTGLLAAGQPAACDIAQWQQCPDAMRVEPTTSEELGVGALRYVSNQIIDLSDYKTAQFLQTEVPPHASTQEWHAHEFDAIIVPVKGKWRFWWLNRDTGEQKNLVFNGAQRAYLLIPHGVPHFVDQRASDTESAVVEYLLSKEVWTAEDFLAHREHIDQPFPPVLPFE